jgi:hypothetical protein
MKKRLRRAAVGIATLAVLGTVASTALATPPIDPTAATGAAAAVDPNTTNVPYLAWRGENIRLEKCWSEADVSALLRANNPSLDPAFLLSDPQLSIFFGSIVGTTVEEESWTGKDSSINSPHEVIPTPRTFLWYDFRTNKPVVCFQDTWTSQQAGLATFKLTVSVGATNLINSGVSIGAQTLVMQHQWLAGWMSLNAPEVNEVSSRSLGSGTAQNPEQLGDADGNGNFIAGDGWYQDNTGKWVYDWKNGHPGQVRAIVTGTMPVDQSTNFPTGSATLPTDWAKLAADYASDSNKYDVNAAGNTANRWDIHDEMVDQHGYTLTGTGGRGAQLTDKVQSGANHTPTTWNGDGSFTRAGVTYADLTKQNNLALLPDTVFQLNLQPLRDIVTSGPFDPNFPEETLLPDGQLNAGDAPMPAARIDFAIAPNTDPLHSTDGVGYFVSTSKAKAYSEDDQGDNAPTNLFAPFYSQYIPATSRDPLGEASGVDGAIVANDFNGFLVNGLYHDWTALPLSYLQATNTGCARTIRDARETPGGGPLTRQNLYGLDGGVQTAAVYSDEHGEARIGFLPGGSEGDGFYFDALANTTPGDTNKGCDLAHDPILGTATISATARYPYQHVNDTDKPGKPGTITKKVYSLFDKHLSYYPKNNTSLSDNANDFKVIVAHAQDINGQPFAGEQVCFTGLYPATGAAIGGMLPHPGHITINESATTSYVIDQQDVSYNKDEPGSLCTNLDNNGNAAFELTIGATIDAKVIAYFPSEGLSRYITVTPGPTSVQDNLNVTPAIALAGGNATTGAGSNGDGSVTPTDLQTALNVSIAAGFGQAVVTTSATPTAPQTITPGTTITPKATITAKKAVARLLSLRLVHPAHGKAYFMIKILSPNKTAKITVALKNQKGKTLSKITKTVQANKLVKIQSSLLKISVKKISLLLVK